MWLFSLTVSRKTEKHSPETATLCRFLVAFSSKSCLIKSEIHFVLHPCYKKQLCLYVLVTFARSRTESDREKEAQPSYFSSMVDADESAHGSMDPSVETWCVACGTESSPPPCFCCFRLRACKDSRPELNWTDATSLHTCWRKKQLRD